MDAQTKTPAGGDHAGADENIGIESLLHPNDARAQRARILKWLEERGPLTTLEARRHIDVMHPAMRVLELREAGYEIETTWLRAPTDCGQVHRIGVYTLRPGAAKVSE